MSAVLVKFFAVSDR